MREHDILNRLHHLHIVAFVQSRVDNLNHEWRIRQSSTGMSVPALVRDVDAYSHGGTHASTKGSI